MPIQTEGKPIPKSVVIVSGGMDSVTLLYVALAEARNDSRKVRALSFDYNQKHKKELERASEICQTLGIEHHIIDITSTNQILESALTREDRDVPEGHYAQSNMAQTVVPNRNAIMLAQAYGYAISLGFDLVCFGAHAGDHAIYPDCRKSFVNALNVAFQEGNEGFGNVRIIAPFISKSKAEIVELGMKLKVPYELTWSCYKGQERPCLKCGTCIERTEAFLRNAIIDPSLSIVEWNEAVGYYNLAKKQYERSK